MVGPTLRTTGGDVKRSLERRAYTCTHKEHEPEKHGVPWRTFLDADEELPVCPEHGAHWIKRQENKPYMSNGDQ